MYCRLIATLIGLFLGCTSVVDSTPRLIIECEKLALGVDEQSRSVSKKDQAVALEETGKACIGTGSFDVALALLYQEALSLNDAERVARAGLVKETAFRPNLYHALAQNELLRGHVTEAYEMGQKVARDYPLYVPILGFLGAIDIKQRRWEQALYYARRVYQLDGSAIALLTMAGPLHQLDQHDEVVQAVYRAIELEPERVGRTTGVLEAIYSLAILGRREEAAVLARKHIDANSAWRGNLTFVRAAEELNVIP